VVNSSTEREREVKRRASVFLPLDWTHSRTDHSIYFQVRMKGRLQTMHVVYSRVTLLREKEREKTAEKSRERVEGCIIFLDIHEAADKPIVASPKTFFFSSRKHFPR